MFLSILLSSLVWAQGLVTPLPDRPPIPKNNPQTKEKIELGQMLYFDPRLSADGTISCNTCHNVMLPGGDDGRATSAGVNGHRGHRSAGTVFNAAFYSVQFWDGRAISLEEQAKGPLTNPIEMGNENHKVVIDRLKKIPGYVKKFNQVFGTGESLNLENLVKAIASYERTLITPDAPFDRFLKGDKKAIPVLAKKGWKTFNQVGCVTCHNGKIFAGPDMPAGTGYFMNFPVYDGSPYIKKYRFKEDKGRFEVTKQKFDRHQFRVPTLRNIANTAPYFHNGSVNSLTEAVRVMAELQLAKKLSDEQVKEIVAFLHTLTGEVRRQKMPKLPASAEASLVKVK